MAASFANDRSLLLLEPNLFIDVVFTGQKLIDASDGVTSGTTLSSASSDFVEQNVHTGQVAVVEGVSYEILDVLSATALTISRLRADEESAAVPPPSGSNLSISIVTFDPQIALVHQQIMRVIRSHAPDSIVVGSDENDVKNAILRTEPLKQIEAMGTLFVIFSGASVFASDDDSFWRKARLYEDRFRQAVARYELKFDTDGDGNAESTHHLNTIQFVRK